MAFIPKEKINTGDWKYTTKEHSSCSGTFEVDSLVKVIGYTERGYDIEDEFGHRMYEIGWTI